MCNSSTTAWLAHYGAIRLSLPGLPTFHILAFAWQMCFPLLTAQRMVIYAPQYPAPPVVPDPQSVLEVTKRLECTAVVTLPSFIEVRCHTLRLWPLLIYFRFGRAHQKL